MTSISLRAARFRPVSYLLALVSLAFFGCSRETPSSSGADSLRVGFSQIGAESAWRTANTESIQSEAAARGIDLVFSDAQQKQENQIRALRSFIAQDVDVIVLAPVVETGWEPVLREIQRAGIPVILSDRKVDVSDPSLYATFIGPDSVEEGRKAAQWLVDAAGGEAVIAELQGTPGSAPALARHKGFMEVIADHPGMKVVKSQSGDFTRARGKEVMEAFLKSPEGKDLTALYAHNDDMALGAIQALEEAGVQPGKDILIVSVDAVRGAFEAMVDGKLNATVECTPIIGDYVFDAAEALAAGEPVDKRIVVKGAVYEQDQAASLIDSRPY